MKEMNTQNITLLPKKIHKRRFTRIQKSVKEFNLIKLFSSSNKGWNLLNKDKWFGSMYQLTAPSKWGSQYLAMNINSLAININIGIIDHIKKDPQY